MLALLLEGNVHSKCLKALAILQQIWKELLKLDNILI